MSDPSTVEPPKPCACANCGATLAGDWCSSCGQNRRGNERLATKAIVGHLVEVITDYESATLRTFCDLWKRPGLLCRDYIEGRRKRYMNPVAYYLLTATATLVAGAWLRRIWPSGHWSSGGFNESAVTYIYLACLVPVAALWSWLFRRSGRNLAETLVFSLYTTGHFLWIEFLLTIPLAILLPTSEWAVLLLLVPFLAYETWAAKVFFGDSWTRATLKVIASLVIVLVVGLIIVGVLDVTGIMPVDVEASTTVLPDEGPSVGHVGREAEQIWAEALLESWKLGPNGGQMLPRFLEAIEKAESKPPLLVALGCSLLGLDRLGPHQFESNEKVLDASEPQTELSRLVANLGVRPRDQAIRCFAGAVRENPEYRPAWQFLALNSDGELRSYAIASWKACDPDNAAPWYLEAESLVAARQYEEALPLFEAGNQCRSMLRFPIMCPNSFSLLFPNTDYFRRMGVAGRPIPVASLRNHVAALGISIDTDSAQRDREFTRWCLKQAELAVERRDVVAERRYLDAVRELGRQRIAMEPPNCTQILVAMALIRETMDPRFPTAEKALGGLDPEVHALRIEGRRFVTAFQDWNKATGRLGYDWERYLTGEMDYLIDEQDAIRRIRTGSRYLQLLDETLLTDPAE